jgi:hypothetical protein
VDGDEATELAELMRRAEVARAAGDVNAARAAFAAAYDRARQSGDDDAMAAAALALAAGQMWGALPGRAPAFLHEAYGRATGAARCRLAAALARAWGYAGNPSRAAGFADEAVAVADEISDPLLLADALDAQLLVHWGPDDLDERLRITTRLEDTVAHIGDVEARLSAHLWRLTTSLERLDSVGVQRQLRALDLLAAESGSPRVRFFTASRQGMAALLRGDTEAAAALRDTVRESGTEAGEPDTFALEHTLAAGVARQLGDVAAMAREAEIFEHYGARDGTPAVTAQGAVLWLESGDEGRAETLLRQVAGNDFAHLVRDAEWLLTITSLTQVAAGVGAGELAAAAVDLLQPYAGRGVVNAGAVAFEGVVDDYLARACASLARHDDAAYWTKHARVAYRRVGATWWTSQLNRLPYTPITGTAFNLRPEGAGIWRIGPEGSSVAVRETKGFAYLRTLLRNPGVPVSALALSDMLAGHPGESVDEADRGEVIDRQALAEYRRRLAEIDEAIDNPGGGADDRRVDTLSAERDALLDQLAAATGLGGRRRRAGASAERARVAVRKAIAAAIARIEDVDTPEAALLRDTIRTGFACSYEPDATHAVRWVLD